MGKRSGCKKLFGLIAALSLSVSGAAKVQASYTTINAPWPGEASDSQILSHSFGGSFSSSGLNFTNGKITATRVDDSQDQVFHFDISSIKTLSTFSSCSQGLAYSAGGTQTQLFNATGNGFSAAGGTGAIDMPASYSLVRTGTGSDWSSDASANSDGADHLVTYVLTGKGIKTPTFVMFWEDGRAGGGGDFDFNDLAVEIKGTDHCVATVPLPAAAWSGMATLATGALMTGYRKARRQMA